MTVHGNRTQAQIDRALGAKRSGPVQLLNLVRLKEKAALPDGRELTGAEAYREYKTHCSPILLSLGATPIAFGQFEFTMAGPDEQWHQIFVMHYPSVEAVNGIRNNPDYLKIAFLRDVAIADFRLLRIHPNAMNAPPERAVSEKLMKEWAASS
jgi:uncharacterized protein (DUF1330 family)